MTGTFTLQLNLSLSLRNRRRLEYDIRQRRVDPADLVSAIVADAEPLQLSLPNEPLAEQTIPIRVYFSPAQRDHFIAFASANQTDIGHLVSALLARYLEGFPDPPARSEQAQRNPAEIAAYQHELRRLQTHRTNLRERAPNWLDAYISDLEAFLK